ncbi:MAG: hypothetical protein ACREA1_08605 [Nitrosotalea sp.]
MYVHIAEDQVMNRYTWSVVRSQDKSYTISSVFKTKNSSSKIFLAVRYITIPDLKKGFLDYW